MSRIFKSYGFMTGKVEQLFELEFAEKLKPFNINAKQYGVLIKIDEKPHLSQKEVAAELKIDRTTMVSFIDHLEALKYLTRTKNPKDRRSYSLTITVQGKQILESCWGLMEQSERKILSSLSNEEADMLGGILMKILETRRINE
ncbi:MarR family winged helix-turn-helix transcriptional regulator [Lysinibacillus sp. NPDC096418]|uniref:MarR family winged helix-turn-helix transcriptional regulator n=1 Tax=Lysinibacillus sp. NPDC096418 TaxID=3364138 RepID=UPI00380281EA